MQNIYRMKTEPKCDERAASRKSGAADCLEALGVKISLPPERSREILEKINLCFLFAQNYHLSMKYVAPVRKELGIRTIFNILGPLTNPAGASMQLMGVYEEALVEPMAKVLMNLGVKKGMVVYGQDCLDEISLSAPTTIGEFRNGTYKKYVIAPEDYGFQRCRKEDLQGGTPEENAAITRAVLNGEKGPKRNAVVLNAAAGLVIGQDGIDLREAIHEMEKIIDSGKAAEQLEKFIQLSNEKCSAA